MALALQTSFTYIIFWTFLRLGYNRKFFPVIETTSHEHYRLTLFILAGAGLEVLFFLLMSFLSTRTVGHGLALPVAVALNVRREYQYFIMWALAHVTTDVFLAYYES